VLSKFRIARASNRQLRDKADEARDAKAWPLAASLYEIYLAQCPRDAPIWVQLGHARKESGDDVQAMEAYLRSLEIAPDVADTHRQIGHLYNKTGKISEAAASYAKAAQLDHDQGHVSQDPVLTAATPEAPSNEDLLLLLADRARDERRWSDAADTYAKYLAVKGHDKATWPLWVQLGHARKEAGENDGAVQAYERAIEFAPDCAETYLHLGHLLKRMGATRAAVAAFTKAVSLDPKIGDAAEELRRFRAQKAGADISYAHPLPYTPEQIAFEPEFPDVYVGLSRCFAMNATADFSAG